MKVSLFDTTILDSSKLLNSFEKLLNSGKFILDKNVNDFENNLSKYLKCNYVVGVNSGTDALELSLKALGIQKGDYVITSGFTYFATIEAIHNVGGKPYLVDINRDTLQIDLENIDSKVLEKANFIIPVHLFGGSVDIHKLKHLSKKYSLKIVEDVAQSFGSMYKKEYLGTIGNAGAFSFYPTKTLGAIGDAGAIATNNKKIYEDLIKMRNHGHIDRDNFKFPGNNSRLDEIQAIFLNERLKGIDEEIELRKSIANFYFESLKEIDGITLYNSSLQTFNYFPISLNKVTDRDKLERFLNSNGIDTAIYYKKPLTDLQFDWISKGKSYKNIDFMKRRIICLPLYPNLQKKQQNFVVKIVKEFFKN